MYFALLHGMGGIGAVVHSPQSPQRYRERPIARMFTKKGWTSSLELDRESLRERFAPPQCLHAQTSCCSSCRSRWSRIRVRPPVDRGRFGFGSGCSPEVASLLFVSASSSALSSSSGSDSPDGGGSGGSGSGSGSGSDSRPSSLRSFRTSFRPLQLGLPPTEHSQHLVQAIILLRDQQGQLVQGLLP